MIGGGSPASSTALPPTSLPCTTCPIRSPPAKNQRKAVIRARLETELTPDQLLHDLVRPRPDLRDPRVAPGAGDAVLVHEPVATVDLHAVVEDLRLDLRRPVLGLRRLDGAELTSV